MSKPFPTGQSGNPTGRPKGSLNKKTLVCKALDEASEAVTQSVIAKAKEGDMYAARLVLERIKPPLRPQSERVQFDLDAQAPLTAQGQQVLAAVAAGELDPETGKLLVDCLHSFAGLRQVDEFAGRLQALEEQAKLGTHGRIAPGAVLEDRTL